MSDNKELYDIVPLGYFEDDWKLQAACRGVDGFDGEPATFEEGDKRVSVCMGCEVLLECKRDVDEWGSHDVFQAGGWQARVEAIV